MYGPHFEREGGRVGMRDTQGKREAGEERRKKRIVEDEMGQTEIKTVKEIGERNRGRAKGREGNRAFKEREKK